MFLEIGQKGLAGFPIGTGFLEIFSRINNHGDSQLVDMFIKHNIRTGDNLEADRFISFPGAWMHGNHEIISGRIVQPTVQNQEMVKSGFDTVHPIVRTNGKPGNLVGIYGCCPGF